MCEKYLLLLEAQYLSSFLIFQRLKLKLHHLLQVSENNGNLHCNTNNSCMKQDIA